MREPSFSTNLKEEDFMKYLLLIATLAAFMGTATATSLQRQQVLPRKVL
jgi:hypothetical protein